MPTDWDGHRHRMPGNLTGNKTRWPSLVQRKFAKMLAMLKHIRWNDVELEKLNPLLDRQMVTGQELMLARVLLKKGCVVPEHSHVNEQLTYILEGALKFWIDGKEIVVRAGE